LIGPSRNLSVGLAPEAVNTFRDGNKNGCVAEFVGDLVVKAA
jgi:hypothetical protein